MEEPLLDVDDDQRGALTRQHHRRRRGRLPFGGVLHRYLQGVGIRDAVMVSHSRTAATHRRPAGQLAGLNLGRLISAVTSSKTMRTGMPIVTCAGSQRMMLASIW